MSNPSNSLTEQLKAMNRRANQMATMHSKLRDDYAWWNSATNFFLLIFSACLLSIAFISDDFLQRTIGMSPDTFKWVNGITATANFSVSLILLAWQPAEKAAAHAQAVNHYAKIRYKIKRLEAKANQLTEDDINSLEESYFDTRDLPGISERQFLPLKQWHLLKVALSKELDVNPYAPLWFLRLKMWLRDSKKPPAQP
ncbi:hypothetical protein [Trichocoleus sp. FACHB-262]|uniref:hypothetical protein n=1 Tax=Trichocoleus sp. FACHB-262 TaxID=2692869 RepID=UPI00168671BF|nr:hypothetical protein [Trichocoleus sp. FACHB-262]MBD2121018.1 hypothetical protein [Trichocoleus sp. FACHB-262]